MLKIRQGLLFLIAFLAIIPDSPAQSPDGNILLLVGHGYSAVKIIYKGDKVWLKANPADKYREITISRISGDTLFCLRDKIRVSQISGFETHKDGYIKNYDLTEWKFFVPPKEVCTSFEMLKGFGSWLARNTATDGSFDYPAWLKSANYKSGLWWSSRRMILFETKRKPDLFSLEEKQIRKLWYPGETRVKTSLIDRIRGDSVYIDGNGFKFSQLDSIVMPYPQTNPFNPLRYNRSDSSSWELFFPPDSVYWSRTIFGSYMTDLNRKREKDHFEWRAPAFRHNMIKLNFSRIANLEFALAYEYRINKAYSLEIEVAGQTRMRNTDLHDIPLDIYPLYKYNGFSVYAGPKFYFNSRGYFQLLLQYRYLQMDYNTTQFPGGQYRLQDQFRNDYGFSLRVGQLIRMGDLIIDGYFGVGLKAVYIHQVAYGYYYSMGESDLYLSWYNKQHIPEINEYTQLLPIIGLGIKIGFGF